MPIFSFIEYTLPELFGKTDKWWQMYKKIRETLTCSWNVKEFSTRHGKTHEFFNINIWDKWKGVVYIWGLLADFGHWDISTFCALGVLAHFRYILRFHVSNCSNIFQYICYSHFGLEIYWIKTSAKLLKVLNSFLSSLCFSNLIWQAIKPVLTREKIKRNMLDKNKGCSD